MAGLMAREGRALERIARNTWRRYTSSYSPKMYIRTQNAEKSIRLGRVQKIGNYFEIRLTYLNHLAYHDSIFDKQKGTKGRWRQGHAIMLISNGWHAKKLERRIGEVYRFTYFEGTDYLSMVEKAYNARKPAGIELEVRWTGSRDYTRW